MPFLYVTAYISWGITNQALQAGLSFLLSNHYNEELGTFFELDASSRAEKMNRYILYAYFWWEKDRGEKSCCNGCVVMVDCVHGYVLPSFALGRIFNLAVNSYQI